MYNYITLGPYEGTHKDIAKKVKELDPEAMMLAAAALKNIIPGDSVLIPMPSHTGEPSFSLVLCKLIAAKIRCPLLDCLRGESRESLCDLKNREYVQNAPKGSLLPHPEDLGLRLTGPVPQGRRPVIVDNVIASGTTAVAALRLFGPDAIVATIACDKNYPKIAHLENITDNIRAEKNIRNRQQP